MSDETLFKIVTFFFKLVFVWPFKLLWIIGNWVYEKNLLARADARQIAFEAEQAASQQKAEEQRRSRNTLYAGSQQPDR